MGLINPNRLRRPHWTLIPPHLTYFGGNRMAEHDYAPLLESEAKTVSPSVPSPTRAQPVSPISPTAGKTRELALRYLAPTEYPAWDVLVQESPQGSVFCRSWWLRALGGDVRVLGLFERGQLLAGMPMYFEQRLGLPLCIMPKLTQSWGVVMQRLSGKKTTVASKEMAILSAFARHLKTYSAYVQAFHPSLQNWLPFYWNGFKQTSRVTYVLDDLRDVTAIWEGIEHSTRQSIRKAQDCGLTIAPCSVDELLDAEEKTFTRQGRRPQHSRQLVHDLYRAAKQNEAGECFAVRDDTRRVYSAAFLVWDRQRAYGLINGSDPELRKSNANYLLMWHTIEFAAKRSAAYDFGGSMVETIEQFLRCFGGKQVPYNYITKLPFYLTAYLLLRQRIEGC
jgi:hypothetical protein